MEKLQEILNSVQTVIVAIAITYYVLRRKIVRIYKVLEPIIKEAEKRAQDGLIDKADRKAIVMASVAILEARGQIKTTFLTRYLISRVVNYIAGKLPDFHISQEAEELITQAGKTEGYPPAEDNKGRPRGGLRGGGEK